jgi:hypothetical protein
MNLHCINSNNKENIPVLPTNSSGHILLVIAAQEIVFSAALNYSAGEADYD